MLDKCYHPHTEIKHGKKWIIIRCINCGVIDKLPKKEFTLTQRLRKRIHDYTGYGKESD